MCTGAGGHVFTRVRACARFLFASASRSPLVGSSSSVKVGARGRCSSPRVRPPPPGAQTQISRGTTCCGGKASAQTKPLNILSKSIKAPRDWLGLIVCVRYYRGLRGHRPRPKLETALRKKLEEKIKTQPRCRSRVSSPQRGKVAEERFILLEKTCCHFFWAAGVIDNLTAFPSH